jgi:hypothetical protein
MSLESLKKQDWFDSLGKDEYNRNIVFVHYMTIEIIQYIQSELGNVLIYFAGSKIPDKNKYIHLLEEEPITDRDPFNELKKCLMHLQDQYPHNIIQDIFFEIHDGKNAITNLSLSFPRLRLELEALYQSYGFDVIYEELN